MESSRKITSTNLTLQGTSSMAPITEKSLNCIPSELFGGNVPKCISPRNASIDFYTRSEKTILANVVPKENGQISFQRADLSAEKPSSRKRSDDIFIRNSELADSPSENINKKNRVTIDNPNLLAVYVNGSEDSSSQSPPILSSMHQRENVTEIPLRRSRSKLDERLKLNLHNINEIFEAPEGPLSPSALITPIYLTPPDLTSPKKSFSRDSSPLSPRSPDSSPRVSFTSPWDYLSSKSPRRDQSLDKEHIPEKKKEPSDNKLISSFSSFAKKFESKSNLEIKTNEDCIDNTIKEYVNFQKERFAELGEVCIGPNEIHTHFKNMHSSYDTQDVIRHIIKGQVKIKNQGALSIEFSDISELNDPQQVISLTNRIGSLVNLFENNVTCDQVNYEPISVAEKQVLKGNIKNLIDKLKGDNVCKTTEDVAKILSNSLKQWNIGSQPQKNMARLLHAMRQEYDTIRLQPLTALMADQGSKCPRRILDIKTELKQDKDKTILFEFEKNEVTVTHSINLMEKDNTKTLTVTLIATLKAPLHDLENWTFSEELQVNALKKSDIVEAKKLNRLFINAGYKSFFVLPKEF